MDITFDPVKRAETLRNRGLNFAVAAKLFNGRTKTIEDDRFEYGETRFMTAGFLSRRCVVLVWTPRGESRRIISMRFAHASEEDNWFGSLE